MNIWCGMGRLCADPEIRYSTGTANAIAIAKFSIAVDRRFKRDGDPSADFFDITAFAKLGEFAEKYLHKGTKVVISGRLENNDYANKDGVKIRRNVIIAESIEFAESKQAASNEQQHNVKNSNGDGFMNIPDGIDEELPFN